MPEHAILELVSPCRTVAPCTTLSYMDNKTEVYSWRVSSATKSRLQEAARRERLAVAEVLERIVAEHLSARDREHAADDDRQRELHARAGKFAGGFAGTDPHRSADVRTLVRARLTGRRGRAR